MIQVIASRSVPSAPLEFLISPTALLSALSLLCEFADICFVISACTDEQEQQARELLQTAVLDATAALSRPLRPHVCTLHMIVYFEYHGIVVSQCLSQ